MALLASLGAPPVLLIDDAHWLDSASYTALARLADEVPDLLLAVSSRSVAPGGETPEPWRALLG